MSKIPIAIGVDEERSLQLIRRIRDVLQFIVISKQTEAKVAKLAS
jgi:hypothetical protein